MMWQCLASRYLWQSPWYSLREDRVHTPEGRELTFTLVDHPGAACGVPITAGGQVVLIRNYRYAVGEHCLEVPAGGLPDGLSPEEAARRELEEEVGGTAAELRYVGRFYSSTGISNEIVHVYLATG
ncbi:MAG: NUDIX hydrolase, partial [Chloroflexi bacterium]